MWMCWLNLCLQGTKICILVCYFDLIIEVSIWNYLITIAKVWQDLAYWFNLVGLDNWWCLRILTWCLMVHRHVLAYGLFEFRMITSYSFGYDLIFDDWWIALMTMLCGHSDFQWLNLELILYWLHWNWNIGWSINNCDLCLV